MGVSGRLETAEQSAASAREHYARLLEELETLQQELAALEADSSGTLQQVDAHHQAGAANLIHYLGLRRREVRPLQESLAAVGLSSLGRSESRVLGNLQAITTLLRHALGEPVRPALASLASRDMSGSALLEANTRHLFGSAPAHRHVRIMVTLPGEAADDYALIRDLMLQGMDCARINCAHDEPEVWTRIIANIRSAQRETGQHCRILMDLAGPKLRTGEIAPGPAVLKWRPQRDAYGHVATPARIWLHPDHDVFSCPAPADACMPVADDWLAQASVGDTVEFTDTRGALRRMKLVEQDGSGFWAESSQTAYVKPGLGLYLLRIPSSGHPRRVGQAGAVGALPSLPELIRVHRGDTLIVTRDQVPGRPARFDENGRLLHAATIACSSPDIFSSVSPGERVMIDDGRIGGVIRAVNPLEIVVEITQARDGGEKLLSDKGINLPDSQLNLDGLTPQDIAHLAFIARHADIVGLSFVRRPADIEMLQQHLKNLHAEKLGIVLKIETRAAFECLPELIFTLMRSPTVGIMIARGDLAVECGYERLAELQEEIMWLAEAAHLPVIWATQVLEGLAKNGKPSRAEITDAAMSERAECVMLNKGPHILEALRTLDDILRRMQGHQQKKNALLRRLHW